MTKRAHETEDPVRRTPYHKPSDAKSAASPQMTNQEMLAEDAKTREKFVAMELSDGTIHVLHAGADAGKTTLSIRLMKSVAERQPDVECIALTFNVAAAADGEAKVNGAERLTFKTIDSLLYSLYANDVNDATKVDFNVAEEVMDMANLVLRRAVTPEQAMSYADQLETACNSGDPTNLGAVSRILWNAGMKGTWWSHAMLRVRARDDPACRFKKAMAKYKLVIVDEAQDLNLVMISLMTHIYNATTTVYVGDSAQAIYGFMQCTDVKNELKQEYVDWTLYTTFRFGQAICDFVNVRNLCVSPAVAHPDNIDTTIEIVEDNTILSGAHTVLVRRWTEILDLADRYTEAGHSVFIDREKVDEIKKCATSMMPSTWDKSLFKKVDKLKVLVILDRVNKADHSVSIVLSTVHGFKGRETLRVLVTRSVRNARNEEELRLLYVAVTRARHTLYLHGFGVKPERYASVAESLCADLELRNISANVFVAKYTCDLTSHLEAESRVREVSQKNENVFLIRHSQGAYQGEKIANKLRLPLVEWAGGSYHGQGDELNSSVMTLLCEHDRSHPLLRALSSIINRHSPTVSTLPVKLLTTVPDATHFHGLVSSETGNVEAEADDVAECISSFAAYIFFNDKSAAEELTRDVQRTQAKIADFINEQSSAALGAWCTRRQDDVSPTPARYAVVHAPDTQLLTGLFTVAFPWLGVPLDWYYFFPRFIFSHPTGAVHVHKPWRKFGEVGSLVFRNLGEAEASVKLRYDGDECPSAQELNDKTFQEALALIIEEEREMYVEHGRKLVFGPDINIPHIPLCSVLWLAVPLRYRKINASTVCISSPVLKTAAGTGKYDGRLNAKLLTIPQALQWLLIDAFL
ncbi:P-loop containing nucleoside triphosphate hydrolase protein [Tribonema minus]|uniref:P-loop containing nucleoside triphosphate hydrolase protein n=1 Tax=Tribonema minus TaxID=303371 RepID=A0A836CA48_9STRA|nr:P-loop containing nucleoside triphosphate hydrolase protein [Tribonema minus]